MDLWLNIALIVGPLLLGTYLSTLKKATRRTKIVVWIICLIICICGVIQLVIKKQKKWKEVESVNYYRNLQERQELFSKGLPLSYVNGLGKNPLLKHSFDVGQEYKKESKFKKAIEAYKECLNHPNATNQNRIAANTLIANCYYELDNLGDAKKHYEDALNISKQIKDKSQVSEEAKSFTLHNMGFIYRELHKPDEALRYLREALEVGREAGYEEGIANALNNVGLIHKDLGELGKALGYYKEAFKISKKIGYEKGIANTLNDMAFVSKELGKPHEALRYLREAFEIHKKIGYERGKAGTLNNIALIYRDLGKPGEALVYHRQALEIFELIGAKLKKEMVLKSISITEESKRSQHN